MCCLEAFKELLVDNYDMLGLTMQFGTELAALGNSFISCERIFTRELLCPNKDCGWQMRLKALRKNRDYEWDGKHFTGKCPQCGKKVTYNIKDVPSTDIDGKKLRFVSRDAVDMAVQYNQLTGTYKYFYRMPSHIKTAKIGRASCRERVSAIV